MSSQTARPRPPPLPPQQQQQQHAHSARQQQAGTPVASQPLSPTTDAAASLAAPAATAAISRDRSPVDSSLPVFQVGRVKRSRGLTVAHNSNQQPQPPFAPKQPAASSASLSSQQQQAAQMGAAAASSGPLRRDMSFSGRRGGGGGAASSARGSGGGLSSSSASASSTRAVSVAGAVIFAAMPLTRQQDPSIPAYYSAPVVERTVQNVPTVSCTGTQTEFVPLRCTGQLHREGGWPASIDSLMQNNESSFEEESAKYLKRVLREDKYGAQIDSCVKKIMSGLRCNAAIEIYNMHFTASRYEMMMPSDASSSPAPGSGGSNSTNFADTGKDDAGSADRKGGASENQQQQQQQRPQREQQMASVATDPTQEAQQRIADSFISLPRYLGNVSSCAYDVPAPFGECVVSSVAWCPGVAQLGALAFQPPAGYVQPVGEGSARKVYAPLALVVDVDASEKELDPQQQQQQQQQQAPSPSCTVLCAPVEAGSVTSITFGLKAGNTYVIAGTSTGGVIMWDFRDRAASQLSKLKADAAKTAEQRRAAATAVVSHQQSSVTARGACEDGAGSWALPASPTGSNTVSGTFGAGAAGAGASAAAPSETMASLLFSRLKSSTAAVGGAGSQAVLSAAAAAAAEEQARQAIDRASNAWIAPAGTALPPAVPAHRSSVVTVRAVPGRVPHEEFVSVGSDGCILQWDARYLASGPVGTFPLSAVMPEIAASQQQQQNGASSMDGGDAAASYFQSFSAGRSRRKTSVGGAAASAVRPPADAGQHPRSRRPTASTASNAALRDAGEDAAAAAAAVVVPDVPLVDFLSPGDDDDEHHDHRSRHQRRHSGDSDDYNDQDDDGDEEEEEEICFDPVAVEKEMFPHSVEFEPTLGGATRVVIGASEGSVRVVSRLQAPPPVISAAAQQPQQQGAPVPTLVVGATHSQSFVGSNAALNNSSSHSASTPQSGAVSSLHIGPDTAATNKQAHPQQQQAQLPSEAATQSVGGSLELTSSLEGVQYGPLRGIVRNPHLPKFCAAHGSVESASGFCLLAEEARVLLRIGHGGVPSLLDIGGGGGGGAAAAKTVAAGRAGGSNNNSSSGTDGAAAAAVDAVTCLAWHPLRPALLLAGTSCGAIVAWDLNRSFNEPAWTKTLFPRGASVCSIHVHGQGDVAFVTATIEVASSAQHASESGSAAALSSAAALHSTILHQQQQLSAQRAMQQQLHHFERMANMSLAATAANLLNASAGVSTHADDDHHGDSSSETSSQRSGSAARSGATNNNGNGNSTNATPQQGSVGAGGMAAFPAVHTVAAQHAEQQQQQAASVVCKGLVALVRFPSMDHMLMQALEEPSGASAAAVGSKTGGSSMTFSPLITSRRRADLQAERTVLVSVLDHNLHVAKLRMQRHAAAAAARQQQQQQQQHFSGHAASSQMLAASSADRKRKRTASFLDLDGGAGASRKDEWPRSGRTFQARDDDEDDNDHSNAAPQEQTACIVVASADLARMNAQTSDIARGADAIANDFLALIGEE